MKEGKNMKKRIYGVASMLFWMSIVFVVMINLYPISTDAHTLPKHTFQNVAIYYIAQDGYLIDED